MKRKKLHETNISTPKKLMNNIENMAPGSGIEEPKSI